MQTIYANPGQLSASVLEDRKDNIANMKLLMDNLKGIDQDAERIFGRSVSSELANPSELASTSEVPTSNKRSMDSTPFTSNKKK